MKSSVAESNWKRLSQKRQLQVALQVAFRRAKEWKRRFANVCNIGAGFRTSGTETVNQREVVLRFIVGAKRKRIKKGKIPATIRVVWCLGRRRRTLAIPTDVFEHDIGTLHSPFIGTVPDGRRFFGSACCILEDRDNPGHSKYLLSCHHVLTGSCLNDADPLQPIPETRITRSDLPVGPCVLAGTLRPDRGKFAMDAAFLSLELPTSMPSLAGFWGQVKPSRLARFSEAPDDGQTCGIFSFRGMIPARFVAVFPNMEVEVKQGHKITFEYVIETIAETKEGDSGAALMDDNGVVYGLHFFGGVSPQFNALYSLAIPIWTIVGKSNYFHRNLALVGLHP